MALTNRWRHFSRPGVLASGLFLIIFVPFIINSAMFVFSNFSRTPFWDIWSWIGDYQSFVSGHYTLHDLVKPHNEHRIVTTRLLLFIDALWFHMSGKFVLAVNWALLGITGVILGRMTSATGQSYAVNVIYVVPATAWMLSTVQWIALLTPFQVQSTLLCVAILMASVAVVRSTCNGGRDKVQNHSVIENDFSSWWGFAAGLFYFLGAFSMAGGFLALPSLLLAFGLSRPRRKPAFIFLVATGLSAILFLLDYNPAHAEPMVFPSSIASTLSLARFASQFLGSAFAAFPGAPMIAGMAGISVYVLGLFVVLRMRFKPGGEAYPKLLVPITSAGIMITIAASAAIARSSGGLDGSLEPRYATMSLIFLGCTACTCAQLWRLSSVCRRLPVAVTYFATAALILLAVAACNIPKRYRVDAEFSSSGLKSEAQAIRRNVFVPALYRRMVFGRPDELSDRLEFLRRQRLSIFAPGAEMTPPRKLISLIQSPPATLQRCIGHIDYVYREDAHRFVIRGMLASSRSHQSADWIALASTRGAILDVLPASEARKLPTARGGRRLAGFGVSSGSASIPSGGEQNLDVVAFGLFSGASPSLCFYEPPIGIGPIRVQTLDSLVSIRSVLSDITFEPLYAFRPATLTLPPPFNTALPTEAFFSTAAAGDAATGAVIFTIQLNGSEDVAVPFETGPNVDGQSIDIEFHDGASTQLPIPADTGNLEWRIAAIPFEAIARHGGGPIKIIARDEGNGWGQWLAIGSPVLTNLDPDWAKLY